MSGGGAYGDITYSTLYNCTLISNSATDINGRGGGVMDGFLYNCTLIGNTAKYAGGAVFNINESVCNSLIIGNKASGNSSMGGGVYGGNIYNCTIVGNYADTAGGGTAPNGANGRLYNCIVYFNDAPADSNCYNVISITNCCTTPMPGIGAGNISSDPMLIDKGSNYGTNHVAGNYRLNANSPCVNTGTNGSWTTTYPYDLDGRARIRYGTVDMGAYECIYNGTIICL